MRERSFESEIRLPQPLDKVFAFFSDPANLEVLTPRWLNFHTLTPSPIDMHAGTLIDYRLRVHGIPVRWRTRINEWQPPHRFIDEQIRGPYKLWIHEHVFEGISGGTLVRDRVRYAVPFDWIAHPLIVRRDVQKIFAYRTEQLRKRFGDCAS